MLITLKLTEREIIWLEFRTPAETKANEFGVKLGIFWDDDKGERGDIALMSGLLTVQRSPDPEHRLSW